MSKPMSSLLSVVIAIATPAALAANINQQCLLEAIEKGNDNQTLGEIRQMCQQAALEQKQNAPKEDLLTKRIEQERETAFNPFVITPHRMNYILPVTYTDSVNQVAYSQIEGWNSELKDVEAKFQISFKVPLNYSSMFIDGDGLYFGFTLRSWWQVYADEISSPFRESNYRPELFYVAPTPWEIYDGRTWVAFGVEHESNGRTQLLSRSWNRVFAEFIYDKVNYIVSFRPWWRIPEDDKTDPLDSGGDDNPDIEDFMGHFELSAAYIWNNYEFSFIGRENFSEHKGYAELGMTFPLYGRLRGYLQYTNGYGESLIDYNHNQQRIGVGLALTDMW